MWNELGISGGTAIVILIALYFVIKWAVKNLLQGGSSFAQECTALRVSSDSEKLL